MIRFLLRWILSAGALLLVARFVPGITVASFEVAVLSAVVLALVNGVIGPVLRLLSFPITLLTLGLFALVINAVLFGVGAWLIDGFEVAGPTALFVGAIAYGVLTWLVLAVTRNRNKK